MRKKPESTKPSADPFGLAGDEARIDRSLDANWLGAQREAEAREALPGPFA